MTSTTTTTTDATSISKKNVSEKNTSDDTTTSQPTTSTECKDSTNTGATVQQLLDLVKELKNVSKMSTSTDSPSTTKTCKEEQKPPAVRTPETNAGTTVITKADFENFKREILTISTQNSERFQPPTQSMPGKYSKKKETFQKQLFLILPIFFTFVQVLSFCTRKIFTLRTTNTRFMMYALHTPTRTTPTYLI